LLRALRQLLLFAHNLRQTCGAVNLRPFVAKTQEAKNLSALRLLEARKKTSVVHAQE
jgi:hypothetical protein